MPAPDVDAVLHYIRASSFDATRIEVVGRGVDTSLFSPHLLGVRRQEVVGRAGLTRAALISSVR